MSYKGKVLDANDIAEYATYFADVDALADSEQMMTLDLIATIRALQKYIEELESGDVIAWMGERKTE